MLIHLAGNFLVSEIEDRFSLHEEDGLMKMMMSAHRLVSQKGILILKRQRISIDKTD